MLLLGDSDSVETLTEIPILVHDATAEVKMTRRRSEEVIIHVVRYCQGTRMKSRHRPISVLVHDAIVRGWGLKVADHTGRETPLCSRRTRLSRDFDGKAKAGWENPRSQRDGWSGKDAATK